jgi:hypothetical protein
LPGARTVALQIACIGQLFDAPRNSHPRQARLLSRCGGHGTTLGRTAQDDCIIDVQHLYPLEIFQMDLLYISKIFIESFMFFKCRFSPELWVQRLD